MTWSTPTRHSCPYSASPFAVRLTGAGRDPARRFLLAGYGSQDPDSRLTAQRLRPNTFNIGPTVSATRLRAHPPAHHFQETRVSAAPAPHFPHNPQKAGSPRCPPLTRAQPPESGISAVSTPDSRTTPRKQDLRAPHTRHAHNCQEAGAPQRPPYSYNFQGFPPRPTSRKQGSRHARPLLAAQIPGNRGLGSCGRPYFLDLELIEAGLRPVSRKLGAAAAPNQASTERTPPAARSASVLTRPDPNRGSGDGSAAGARPGRLNGPPIPTAPQWRLRPLCYTPDEACDIQLRRPPFRHTTGGFLPTVDRIGDRRPPDGRARHR